MSIEAMKQALEALEWNLPVIEDYGDKEQFNRQHKAIAAIYEALKKPKQKFTTEIQYTQGIPFFVPPPQREWVGLTDEEMQQACYETFSYDPYVIARAIEAKLKEKNT